MIKLSVTTWIIITLFALSAVQTVRTFRLKHEAALAVVALQGKQDTIDRMSENVLDGNTIADLAANACRSSINFRINATTEAQEIRNATTTPGGANAAYDRLMCQRPEAINHPRCQALPQ